MKRVLVTGGGGYVGAVLVRKLLLRGYFVRVLDLFLYDSDPFRNIDTDRYKGMLDVFKADIRKQDVLKFALEDIDVVIHLACISNDPGVDLNPELGKSINLDAFEPLVKAAKEAKVHRFINASSSSVYGINEDKEVTEESKCNPLTDYSKFKLETEKILLKYESSTFTTVSVRSATVCGYSPRQRLDVIVNILANHAYHLGKITVTGGDQKRPNVHINDIADFYVKLTEVDHDKISGQVFNFGGPNYTVNELANLVKKTVKKHCEIYKTDTNDPRSYHISSKKALDVLGLAPKKSIEDAIDDLSAAFEFGLLSNTLKDSKFFNIEKMKELNLK